MSKAAEHLAYAFDLIDPVQTRWLPGDRVLLYGEWLTLDWFDERKQWWVTQDEGGREVLVTPENLPDRARGMHSGRVEYSPDAPVRNMTLAREGVEHGK